MPNNYCEFKGLLRNKVYRIGDVILCSNKAKNVAIALAKTRLFNEVSVQKNKTDKMYMLFRNKP